MTLTLTVTLPELPDRLPDVVVDHPGGGDPLDHVKGIDNRNCIWKVFINIRDILVIHIRYEILDCVSFLCRDRDKVWFRDVGAAAAE